MDSTGKRYERDRTQEPAQDRSWRWFITVTAVGQWMRLTGRGGPLATDNPDYVEALAELGALSQTAGLAVEKSDRREDGASVYRKRLTVKGRKVRVECVVMPPLRKEGDLPQLVGVELK